MLLAFYASAKVRTSMSRFANVATRKGLTGAQIAEEMLSRAGVRDVNIEMLNAPNGDHYDPKSRTIRLSAPNFKTSSITAVAVAAHEAGHAIQHNEEYVPLAFRSGIFPLVRISSMMAMPLIIIGFIFAAGGEFSMMFINLGIIFFAVTVFFHLVTLPVEFNASNRAMELLEVGRYLEGDEIDGAKKVLNAAALTYVAAAAAAISQLLRLVLLSGRRR